MEGGHNGKGYISIDGAYTIDNNHLGLVYPITWLRIEKYPDLDNSSVLNGEMTFYIKLDGLEKNTLP